jgi:hypothetical protein
MKFLIPIFLVVIFASIIVIAQPIRITKNNGNMDLLGEPCPVSPCLACEPVCNVEGCDIADCMACIAAAAPGGCNEGIPIDGGLVWLLLAGIGLKTGHFIQSKRSGKNSLKDD